MVADIIVISKHISQYIIHSISHPKKPMASG